MASDAGATGETGLPDSACGARGSISTSRDVACARTDVTRDCSPPRDTSTNDAGLAQTRHVPRSQTEEKRFLNHKNGFITLSLLTRNHSFLHKQPSSRYNKRRSSFSCVTH